MNSLEPEDQLSAVLSNFWEEIFPKVEAYAIPIILERIKSWVGEQPDLTAALCSSVIQAASVPEGSTQEASQFNEKADKKTLESAVDQIVQKELIESWQSSSAVSHLNTVKTAILEYDRRDSLLILYIQILQRGKVAVSKSPEQAVLISTGLAKIEHDHLKVANAVYAKIFDLTWVEQQLPGITKPVAIISSAAAGKRLFQGSTLYSKIAAVAFGLVVLGAAISSYLREPSSQASSQAMAIPNAVLNSDSKLISSAPKEEKALAPLEGALEDAVSSNTAEKAGAIASDRSLFDKGAEHAQNSRWVPMMREFCNLSEDSTYFAPAEKRLAQWVELYEEDVEIAHDIVAQEQDGPCPIAKNVLDSSDVAPEIN
jgi:hypothetical protein